MSLTSKQKEDMKADDFAVPGKKKLPIHDKRHTELAWQLLSRTQGLSDDEVAEAKRRILSKAKSYGIDTSKWKTGKAEDKKAPAKSKSKIAVESFTDSTVSRYDIDMVPTVAEVPGTEEVLGLEGFKEWIGKITGPVKEWWSSHNETKAFFNWCDEKHGTDVAHNTDDFNKLFPDNEAFNSKLNEFYHERTAAESKK